MEVDVDFFIVKITYDALQDRIGFEQFGVHLCFPGRNPMKIALDHSTQSMFELVRDSTLWFGRFRYITISSYYSEELSVGNSEVYEKVKILS